jgi:hypothetical protein
MFMNEERKKILEMVASGKISVEEAERLMNAMDENPDSEDKGNGKVKNPKYLRIQVEPGSENSDGERVNVRIPINLIKAGLKFASFIPKSSQNKVDDALKGHGLNIDFDNLTSKDVDELIVNLNDLQIDVDGDEIVKIFCE